jgi:hypothetical protein
VMAPMGGVQASGLAGRRSDAPRAPLARLHPNVRDEVERLIAKLGGVVRVSRTRRPATAGRQRCAAWRAPSGTRSCSAFADATSLTVLHSAPGPMVTSYHLP